MAVVVAVELPRRVEDPTEVIQAAAAAAAAEPAAPVRQGRTTTASKQRAEAVVTATCWKNYCATLLASNRLRQSTSTDAKTQIANKGSR